MNDFAAVMVGISCGLIALGLGFGFDWPAYATILFSVGLVFWTRLLLDTIRGEL